ncbi:MAG: serine hydrolase [Lysobacterales bacterium]
MSKYFLCVVFTFGVLPPSQADNGQVAYAVSVGNIMIDGDLSDWPQDAMKHSIAFDGGQNVIPGTDNFTAHFRAGYQPGKPELYLALEVTDDIHRVTDNDEVDWSTLDSVIAYIDFNHSSTGSGAALYLALGERRSMLSGAESWDSDVAKATWDNAQAVVKRTSSSTIYEWKLTAPKPLESNTTLGLDFLIADQDQAEEGSAANLYSWGPGFGKSQAGGRTGDLLLVEPGSVLGVLSGQIAVDSDESGDSPVGKAMRVRIRALKNPNLWVQARSDDTGRYEVSLPAGQYSAGSVDRVIRDTEDRRVVFQPSSATTVTVSSGAASTASDLILSPVDSPLSLPERGALFDFDQASEAALNATVKTLMAHFQVPGLSLALIKDGELAFHNTYGVSNAYSQTPVQADTLFEAASITKTVFAFAVNRLAERGIIDLDRPLHTYLPFEDIAHDERYKKITARLVLSHQTGLPNWRWMNDDGKLDIKFYPGIKYGYSGEGFEYLGRVVSHVTGKPLEDILREEALKPMGFEVNTYFSVNDELRQRASRGHLAGMTGPHDFPSQVGVAHSMYTEAKSFAPFMLGLLAKKGLSAESYKKMFEPQVETPLSPGSQPRWPGRYGLGFHLMNTPFGLALGHGGNNGNFTCKFELYPEQGFGFVVFTNADNGSMLVDALREYLIMGQDKQVAAN